MLNVKAEEVHYKRHSHNGIAKALCSFVGGAIACQQSIERIAGSSSPTDCHAIDGCLRKPHLACIYFKACSACIECKVEPNNRARNSYELCHAMHMLVNASKLHNITVSDQTSELQPVEEVCSRTAYRVYL